MTTKTSYRVPRVHEEVEVSLDSFDMDDIREYMRQRDHSDGSFSELGSFSSHGSLTLGPEDLGRIATLALCGQRDAAREAVLEIVARHIGRPL